MRITLSGFGVFKGEAILEPAPLTVLTGANNSGKTYAMYVMWGLFQRALAHQFDFSERLADELRAKGTVKIDIREFFSAHWGTILRGISKGLKESLTSIFSAPDGQFDNAQTAVQIDLAEFIAFAEKRADAGSSLRPVDLKGFDVRFSFEANRPWLSISLLSAADFPKSLIAELLSGLIVEVVMASAAREAFLLPAERAGLNLFYLDLDAKNSALVRHLKRDTTNPMELLQDMMVAQYARPIDGYIKFLKQAPRTLRGDGPFHDEAVALQRRLARVRYKVSKDGVITAKPYRSDRELGIHLTSSAVKNFYGLWAWLEGQAKVGDCLMIDEPELNLHPDNQRLIARLLVRLVNRGIRVVISTHSDYVIRELNNMIMLSTEFPSRAELEKKFGYADDGCERISSAKVRAYNFSPAGVSSSKVCERYGIEVESMDSAINSLNSSNSDIYFALGEKIDPVSDAVELRLQG